MVLGIDVGGSSVKAGLVDVEAGRLLGTLISVPTPQPATPAALTAVFGELAARLPGSTGRVGVTPDVNALATILVLLVATGIAISTVWMRYRERRRKRDLQLAAAANL